MVGSLPSQAKRAEIFLEVKSVEANVYDWQSEDTICKWFDSYIKMIVANKPYRSQTNHTPIYIYLDSRSSVVLVL